MGRNVFEGVKIADFGWYAAGPVISRELAQYGAEVIHIESATRIDGHRSTPPYLGGKPHIDHAAYFLNSNSCKYGITLDLKKPQGLAVAKKIVAWADIVVENFIPGTMEGLGLGYEDLRKINPDIIMLSSCNQGQTGPHAKHRGFGSQLTSLAGFVEVTGWPDRQPVQVVAAYTDYVSVVFGVILLVASLVYRQRTGKGQYMDLSQYECNLLYLAPYILDFVTNGRVAKREGNRCPYAAPHGVYPCKGEDRWCTISVFTDEEWANFCEAIGNPQLIEDGRFATLLARKQNEEDLNQILARWTKTLAPEEVMTRLQGAGVAAAVVKNNRETLEDPQLRHRHQFWEIEHPDGGMYTCDAPSFILSKVDCQLNVPAPCLGQHNAYVCTKILGMSDDEFVEALENGVFA